MKKFQELSRKEQKLLLTRAIQLLAEWKPIPQELGQKLGPETLSKLLEMVRRIRDQGLAGSRHRPPERLRLMKQLLAQMIPDNSPKQDIAEQMPEPARSQQKGAESLLQRQADAQEGRAYKRELRNRRRGSSLL
jgi:hypothetical protein